MEIVPNRVKEFREKERLTQAKLAQLSGRSPGFIHSLEKGTHNPQTISKLDVVDGLNKGFELRDSNKGKKGPYTVELVFPTKVAIK